MPFEIIIVISLLLVYNSAKEYMIFGYIRLELNRKERYWFICKYRVDFYVNNSEI